LASQVKDGAAFEGAKRTKESEEKFITGIKLSNSSSNPGKFWRCCNSPISRQLVDCKITKYDDVRTDIRLTKQQRTRRES
jgi:hypothetical protein